MFIIFLRFQDMTLLTFVLLHFNQRKKVRWVFTSVRSVKVAYQSKDSMCQTLTHSSYTKYIIVPKCFCYILVTSNKSKVCQRDSFLTRTKQINLGLHISGFLALTLNVKYKFQLQNCNCKESNKCDKCVYVSRVSYKNNAE